MADYVDKKGAELGEAVNEDEDEWVVVSPTASAYTASSGPKVHDLVHKENASAGAGNEAETSQALFMSDHFIYVPGQHKNLPAVEEDQEIHKGEKDLASELQSEEGDRSKQKEKDNLNIPGLKITENFSVSNAFYGKGGSVPIHDSEFDETTLCHGVKATAVEQVIYDGIKNNEIPLGRSASLHDVTEPSENALDPVVPWDESDRKDDNCDKNYSKDPPSRAWWEKPVACLHAHVNESNAIWSILIAAAIVGLVILGQKWQQERKQVLRQRLQLNLTTEKPETDDAHSHHMGGEEDFDQERFQEDFPLQFSTVAIVNSPFPEDVHIGQVGISDIGSTFADSDNLHTQCDNEDEGERRMNYTEVNPYDINSKPTLAVGMKFAKHEERCGEPIRDDKDWKLSAFRQRVRRDLQIDASLKQIYQAKRKALQFIHGHDLEQFFKLFYYCDLLKEKNLGSLAGMSVKIEGNNQFPTFRRLFLAFRACIKGFFEVRSHLRNGLSQILPSAVGREPNNQMFPAAIALGKILPPGYKQLPGRPRKAGRKAGDEPKIQKKMTRKGCKMAAKHAESRLWPCTGLGKIPTNRPRKPQEYNKRSNSHLPRTSDRGSSSRDPSHRRRRNPVISTTPSKIPGHCIVKCK